MKAGRMKRWVTGAVMVVAAALLCAQAASSRSLLHDVEKGLTRVKRDLCQVAPSSKCKPVRKGKPATKIKPADKDNAPAAPQAKPAPAVPLPQEKPATLKVPPPDPPLPRAKPKDLKVDQSPAKTPDAQVPAVAPPKPAAISPLPQPVPPPAPVPAPPATEAAGACLQALTAAGVVFLPVTAPLAVNSSECVIDNPVKITGLKTAAGLVKLPDQPTLACSFAVKLEDFVSSQVQPLAQSDMQSPLITMGTGPGFDCRGRNGDSPAKISEHARGNAIDIVFFNFASKIGVLVKDAGDSQSPGFAFLRDVRAAACKAFTTVLGPGSNAAHAEHFHIDLEARKGDYRICE